MRLVRRTLFALAMAAAITASLVVVATPLTRRVVGPTAEGNGISSGTAVSADGSTVVFRTTATNLAAGGGGIVAYDLRTRAGTLLTPGANGSSFLPSVSRTGRHVAFETGATNLAPGNDSGFLDVLHLDRATGTFVRASQGLQGAAANGPSQSAAISGDGRWVAFSSSANNLVASDGNNARDIFVFDAQTGAIERASVGSNGEQANKESDPLTAAAMSGDGRYVAFTSAAETIAPVFAGNTTDVFVRDRVLGTTMLVSQSTGGVPATLSSSTAAISPNGRYVVFRSAATDLAPGGLGSGMFVRALVARTTSGIPPAAGLNGCTGGRIDDTGTVVLLKCATLSGSNQVYVYRAGSGYALASAGLAAQPGNGVSGANIALSGDGMLAAFDSDAIDLVPDDLNNATDVFLVGEPPVFDRLLRDSFED